VHNPSSADDRRKAVEELARVVKPGGVMVVLDLAGFSLTRLYAKTLTKMGWKDVKCEFAGMGVMFGIWYCNIVTAQKPW